MVRTKAPGLCYICGQFIWGREVDYSRELWGVSHRHVMLINHCYGVTGDEPEKCYDSPEAEEWQEQVMANFPHLFDALAPSYGEAAIECPDLAIDLREAQQ